MSLSLAPIFASGMVLQRELPVRLWGEADPGTPVEVRIQSQTASCVADTTGSWSCTLAPLAASDAETLEITAGESRLTLTDVAVGEGFVAGGQSSMELWMRYGKEGEDHRPT